MADNEWDEDRIEQLLREFPKIEDHRPKEEVHKRLKKTTAPVKKPKKWLPAAVAAAAFLTLAVLLGSLLGRESGFEMAGMGGNEESAAVEEEAVMESTEPAEEAAEGEAVTEEAAGGEESTMESAELAPSPEGMRTAVYADDMDGHALLPLGLTENAFVVPVSVLIPLELLPEGMAAEQAADLYNAFAAGVDEESLGFDEYHPFPGTIVSQDDSVFHELPAEHDFGLSSATASVYITSLQETFPNAEEIAVVTEGGEQAEFDPFGPVEPVQGGTESTPYYVFTTADGHSYLAPDYGANYASAAEALLALQTSPNDLLASPVPDGLTYTVQEEAGVAVVAFTEPLDLTVYDDNAISRLLESLALTAGTFGVEVLLENTEQMEWMGYDLSRPLDQPLAPNKILWSGQ